MATIAAARPPIPVRHNQTLDYSGLRAEAEKAVGESGKTRSQVAAELDKTPAAVSRALSEEGAKFAALQVAIIEHLTGFTVRDEREVIERVRFRVLREA